ncbi:MAG TPA: pyridoxamine 5'-phosphate oxidase family protein [Blastocatellia bacterium]|nr:pyridoxamine 5'-phosphate oxidase family protein [Blastocatellia bacterium]
MLVTRMKREECNRFLAKNGLARLACEMDGQPYVVPVYLISDGRFLFGFATMGFKIDCMRANPRVCVEFDEIKNPNQWVSVVVFGDYEELPDMPEYRASRNHALDLLKKRAMWWEPASVAVENSKPISPIFYRITIDRITGRRATP